MRFYLLLMLSIVLAGYFLLSNAASFWGLGTVQKAAFNTLYQRKLQISGNLSLSQGDVLALLPQSTSNLWWFFNQESLERSLQASPLVKLARVDPCGFGIDCYEIQITERHPKMITTIEKQAWLVDEQGAFLLAIPKNRDPNQEALRLKLPLVRLAADALSELSPADIFKKLYSEIKAFDVLPSSVKLYSIDITSDGELKTRFVSLPMLVTFSGFNKDLSYLKIEVGRLAEVLAKFENRLDLIESIDIAYDRLAVVKLKNS